MAFIDKNKSHFRKKMIFYQIIKMDNVSKFIKIISSFLSRCLILSTWKLTNTHYIPCMLWLNPTKWPSKKWGLPIHEEEARKGETRTKRSQYFTPQERYKKHCKIAKGCHEFISSGCWVVRTKILEFCHKFEFGHNLSFKVLSQF